MRCAARGARSGAGLRACVAKRAGETAWCRSRIPSAMGLAHHPADVGAQSLWRWAQPTIRPT